jgi:transposase-like protein
MVAERGVIVSHSTILRWVQRYVPEFEQRWGRYARRVHSSWRMDETAVPVRGGAHYLYRAVDKHGKTVEPPNPSQCPQLPQVHDHSAL